MLAHLQKQIGNVAANESEIARVERNGVGAHPGKQAVVHRRRELLKQGFALALEALAVDDVRAVFPHLDHLRNQLRRVLQIDVDDDQSTALCRIHTAGHRELVAKVAGEREYLYLLVLIGKLAQLRERIVTTAVVDVDDFIGVSGALHRRVHPRKRILEHFLLVEYGNHKGQHLLLLRVHLSLLQRSVRPAKRHRRVLVPSLLYYSVF
ncbi:hypothetical protein SDC9_149974 [bioreactor metagenome]|uniref:Uncharacterized protein n=1 Tax=bioreactor metagenome TaxID=1076179 RepID=A0A645EL71_9ZZZZ